MTSSTSSSRLAAVLAVVAPTAIVALALLYLGREEAASADAAAVAPEVGACLTAVERTGDDVVIVGNSKSGTDIDRAGLAQAMGIRAVAKVGGPGSSAPLWYASLERCVFEAGFRPRLVIVYGTAGATLRATLDSELERLLIAPYLGEHEPVLDLKVFGGEPASPFWQRVRTRKTKALLALQHGVRDGVAGLFFAPPGPDGLLAAGRAYAEPALETVLGADGADTTTRYRAIPIAEAESRSRTLRNATVDQTLVPDLIGLAAAHGARIVFVQAPVAASKVDTYDSTDPALIREMVAALNAQGAGYIDLTTLGLPASAYGDGIHMNSNGRALLTAALARQLADIDALGTEPFRQAALPRVPATMRRDGAGPTLPALTSLKRGPWECGWQVGAKGLEGVSDAVLSRLGIGAVSPLLLFEDGVALVPHASREEFDVTCSGSFAHQAGVLKFSPTGGPADVVPSRVYTLGVSDAVPLLDRFGREALWVYPGTTMRADAVAGWDSPVEGFAVYVEALVAIPGTSPAVVSWEGGTEPLVPVSSVGSATLGGATLLGPAPKGPWTVEVRSPADGPWLLVRRVVAGNEAAPWYMVGGADTGRTVDLFKGELTVDTTPPPLGPLGKVGPAKDGGWRIDSSALEAPESDLVYRVSGVAGCSPVIISEDGVPLPGPNTSPRLIKESPGGYMHTAFGVLFSTVDGSSPLENGRAYTAALSPDRTCRTGRWLYPGDVARFQVGAEQLRRLSRGASRLELTAADFGGTDPTARLTVRLLVDGELLFEGDAPLAGIATTPPSWDLPAPVGSTAENVVVELSSGPGAPFVMFTALSLLEPSRPAFPAGESLVTGEPPAAAPLPDGAPRGAGSAAP